MLSFRSELESLENPVVQNDILDLADKISKFRNLQLDNDKFRSVRLARGIYGQRQEGVQMVRIKIPYGRMTTRQLRRIAALSDEYASSNLHATTRQDIQIHYVSLDRTPELWAKLQQDNITIREACGNTVRNVTASDKAGVDPNEPFDVSPYAQATFEYFLRNPICQEMGRKFKISFSSSDEDSALSFIHDLGFIAKVKTENGKEVRGFKVMLAGGLGPQPYLALPAKEFLPEDQLIPYAEAVIRVFDRYGERARRNKARLKYLLGDIGLEAFLQLVDEERTAIWSKSYNVDINKIRQPKPQPEGKKYPAVAIEDRDKYERWLKTNVFEQKQKGFYGVYARVLLGNMSSDKARELADIVDNFAADELRVTVNQNYLLKFVRKEALESLFVALDKLGFAEPGYDSTADVTACPGTDTCNLGISSSTGIAAELERMIKSEYPDLIYNTDIKIKISGCPNSCGQHGFASIGFHGSSMKVGANVLPALQVLLGGGVDGNGQGRMGERVIKVPSKRGPDVVRWLLEDYDKNANDGEYFKDYYVRQGKIYFYELLKPLTDTSKVVDTDFIDWGRDEKYFVKTATGECAGVIIDLVDVLLFDSDEKLELAETTLKNGAYADSIYHSYSVFLNSAKALLLGEGTKNNTQMTVINDFDKLFVEKGLFTFEEGSFKEHVLRINKNEPTKEFAELFKKDAQEFLKTLKAVRENQLSKVA